MAFRILILAGVLVLQRGFAYASLSCEDVSRASYETGRIDSSYGGLIVSCHRSCDAATNHGVVTIRASLWERAYGPTARKIEEVVVSTDDDLKYFPKSVPEQTKYESSFLDFCSRTSRPLSPTAIMFMQSRLPGYLAEFHETKSDRSLRDSKAGVVILTTF